MTVTTQRAECSAATGRRLLMMELGQRERQLDFTTGVQTADTRCASYRYDRTHSYRSPWSPPDALVNQIDKVLFAEYFGNIQLETENDLNARADYFSSRDDSSI